MMMMMTGSFSKVFPAGAECTDLSNSTSLSLNRWSIRPYINQLKCLIWEGCLRTAVIEQFIILELYNELASLAD